MTGGPEYIDRFLTSLSAAFLAVFDHPAPVVGAVNGHAIAGGCVFAMATDMRLMSGGTIGVARRNDPGDGHGGACERLSDRTRAGIAAFLDALAR